MATRAKNGGERGVERLKRSAQFWSEGYEVTYSRIPVLRQAWPKERCLIVFLEVIAKVESDLSSVHNLRLAGFISVECGDARELPLLACLVDRSGGGGGRSQRNKGGE